MRVLVDGIPFLIGAAQEEDDGLDDCPFGCGGNEIENEEQDEEAMGHISL